MRIVGDAAGFAAAEAARRVVGPARVSDIDTLDPDLRVVAGREVLRIARRLLLERAGIDRAADLVAIARDELA